MFYTAITTAPRADTQYISEMLDNYLCCFDVKPVVFAEPESPCPAFCRKWSDWRESATRLRIFGNFMRMYKTYLQESKEPFLMCLEDDIHIASQAPERVRQFMMHWNNDKIGMFSPYCSLANSTKEGIANQIWTQPLLKPKSLFFGTLFMVFPRESVQLLVDEEEKFREYSAEKIVDGEPRAVDYGISKVLLENNLEIWTHMPTLVFHTGDVSSHPQNNVPKALSMKARQPAV